MHWVRRALVVLLVAPVTLYVIVAAAFFFAQRWLIFIPAREIDHTPAEYGAAFEEVWLESGRDPGTRSATRPRCGSSSPGNVRRARARYRPWGRRCSIIWPCICSIIICIMSMRSSIIRMR
jgi:hypothetical protein